MSNKTCAGCKDIIKNREGLECCACHLWYDVLCANISEKRFKVMSQEHKRTWICAQCRSKQPKGDNTNTPVRPGRLESPPKQNRQCSPSPTDANVTQRSKLSRTQLPNNDTVQLSRESLREMIRQEMQNVFESVVSQQFRQINELIADFKTSLSFFNDKYEEMKTMMEQKTDRIRKLEKENSDIQDSLQKLGKRVNLVEQNSRSTNVELQCIPENKSENLVITVLQLAKVISCDIVDSDIQHCTRIAKKDSQSTRPRSVLVKLSSPRQRDNFLAAAIKFNRTNKQEKLNTSHLGIAAEKPQPIYVAEHLSAENKAIHAATRIRGKELGYKFVWIRNGKIFIKKDESAQSIVINSLEKLKSLT